MIRKCMIGILLPVTFLLLTNQSFGEPEPSFRNANLSFDLSLSECDCLEPDLTAGRLSLTVDITSTQPVWMGTSKYCIRHCVEYCTFYLWPLGCLQSVVYCWWDCGDRNGTPPPWQ